MNFSTAIGMALSLITVGLSLPAQADTVNTNESIQTAVVSGNNNSVSQSNISIQHNDTRGNRGDRVTSIRNRQTADIEGNNNRVDQRSETYVRNGRL
jgi:hypothetical protein